MFKKIKEKFFTREIITYLIAGVLTTLVNLAAKYIMHDLLGIDENITAAVAWFVAVAFAYFINNYWVFLAGNEGGRKESVKIGKFFAARLFTYFVEAAGTFLLITKAGFNYWLVNIILMFVVTVLNYVFSKLFVFISKDKENK